MSGEVCIDDFVNLVKGKSVAFVGMSPCICGRGYGKEIDSFDFVYRTNMYPLVESLHEDYGSRCDIISYQKYYLHLSGQFYNHGVLIQVPHITEDERKNIPYTFLYVSRQMRELMANHIQVITGMKLLYPSAGVVAYFLCKTAKRFKYFGVTGYQNGKKTVVGHTKCKHYIDDYMKTWGERTEKIIKTPLANYHVHNFEAQNKFLSTLLMCESIEMDEQSKSYFT
jgi:hypothetical protein